MDKSTVKFHRWPYAALLASRGQCKMEWENCDLIQDRHKLGSHLCMAILRGDNRTAEHLIDFGAPLDHQDHPDGWTPLIYSIYYNNVAGREMLLMRGADIFVTDFSGRTVLMFAALAGDHELTGELLKHGMSPAITDKLGRTALDFARSSRSTLCIELLKQ